MDYMKILIASVLSVMVLFFLTKLMGNKQISQLNAFDYITGITIGSIAAEMATDLEDHLFQNIFAMVIYALIAVTISFATTKSMWARKFFAGKPIVLLENDKLYRNRLKKAKLDINEFLAVCRMAGYFDLRQVDTAIFEHNGNISFLPKSAYRPANPDDMSLSPQSDNLFVNLIVDGKVIEENLKNVGKDRVWLKKQMENNGCKKAEEVFLLSADKENNIVVYRMEQ